MSRGRSQGVPAWRRMAPACLLLAPALVAQQRQLPPAPWPDQLPQPLVVPDLPAAAAPDDTAAGSSALPPGFVDETVADGWGQAVGLAFADDGLLLVWERDGRVFAVQDGVKQDEPVLDISEEVGAWGDHGLLGLALDPQFAANGRIFLLYVVDHHHLEAFGTPQYDPSYSEDYVDTIGRISSVRLDLSSSPLLAVPGSERVVLGRTKSDGLPICMPAHGVGSLAFGRDGTLLASCGTPNGPGASGTCLSDGILQPKEDVDAFRAQLVDSLCGKIIRIDPTTGVGLPGNPFYDPLAPLAPRSRVWALGLRNPYRFVVLPGTGSLDPAAADPGTLLVADVGEMAWEELNVVAGAGRNLGWPLFEGLDPYVPGWEVPVYNQDAPNPLFGVQGCDQPWLAFQDLLQQDALLPQVPDNPCAPGLPLPAEVVTFVHARPALAWSHVAEQALLPVYGPAGEAAAAELGAAGSPAQGPGFGGVCAVGGTWLSGAGFPAEWQDAFFMGDYGNGWIRALRLAPDGSVAEVQPFALAAGAIVSLAVDPQGSGLHYLNLAEAGGTALHRIRHVPGNQPPVAQAGPPVAWGPAGVEVAFSSTGSADPEGAPLGFAWDFGDGTFVSRRSHPTHRFPSQDVTGLGTIVSRLDELTPPWSMGLGNPDPEVIRDGFVPPPGSLQPLYQFDTFHFSPPTGLPDKGGEDWIGYVFDEPHVFTGVQFTEGLHWPPWGGWLDDLAVQVRVEGAWVDVPGMVSVPAYPGPADPTCETFELLFEPATGDGLRLHGVPGGSWEFFGVGELRVSALAPPPAGPLDVQVQLTLTDDLGHADFETLLVSLDNTPPQVQVLQPVNGQTWPADVLTALPLEALATDAEQGTAMACAWEVILHHDEHEHPEPLLPACTGHALLQPHGEPGAIFWYELRFSATDPLGLASSQAVWVLPEHDLNLNGVDDVAEVAAGAPDLDGNGLPDDVDQDCDADGLPDVVDVKLGLGADADGNGQLDACDPVTWTDLGNAKPGSLGTPLLAGVGPLVAGAPIRLDLVQAAPSSPVTLVAGLSAAFAPYKAGTMVPAPQQSMTLVTDGDGAASLVFDWPVGVPADVQLYFQFWIEDAGATFGVAASNGLQGLTR